MIIRLSSKGRVAIPKILRENLQLKSNCLIRVHAKDGKIILEPLPKEVINRLYGKYAGNKLLNDLESEHLQEK